MVRLADDKMWIVLHFCQVMDWNISYHFSPESEMSEGRVLWKKKRRELKLSYVVSNEQIQQISKSKFLFCWALMDKKFSTDDNLKYFSYFSQKTGFDISCILSPMETICMKCQILMSGNNKKNVTNLSSAEVAQRVPVVKITCPLTISSLKPNYLC